MLYNLAKNIRKQWLFFILYLLFLMATGYILYNYHKADTTRIVNATWTDFQDMFFSYFTHVGDFITAVIVIVILLFYRYKIAIMAASSFIFSALITQFLKKIVYGNVARPTVNQDLYHDYKNGVLHLVDGIVPLVSYSFPSGHTTSAFSIFFFLSLLINKRGLTVLFFILAALAGYSRAYLSHHFLEDVFVGSMIGTFATLVMYSLMEGLRFGNWGEKSLLNNR